MLMCDSQQEAVMSSRAISFHFVHGTFEIKVLGPSVSISGASLLITILDAEHLTDLYTFTHLHPTSPVYQRCRVLWHSKIEGSMGRGKTIHLSIPLIIHRVMGEPGAYPRELGARVSCQPKALHNCTYIQTLLTVCKCQSAYSVCLWILRGNQST